MNIVCFHLYNDYSGSPKVLKNVLDGLLSRGHDVDLVTSKGGALDALSTHSRFRLHANGYKFYNNQLLRLLKWSWVQAYTTIYSFRFIGRKNKVFYINTILPLAGAVAGKLMGKRVVYHYHENAKVKSKFYWYLSKAMEWLADEIICVSEYQASKLSRRKHVVVIPNAMEADFIDQLHPDPERAFGKKKVMMLSSLKSYKGTLEFITLAQDLQEYTFVLVVNDTAEAISDWLAANKIEKPSNLTIYPRVDNVAPMYNDVSLVINLSNKNQFVETFGLTALEAMSDALPVIVPTEGGIAEMVQDGWNGFKIDVQTLALLEQRIHELFEDKDKYLSMAAHALESSHNYCQNAMVEAIERVLKN